MLRHCLVDMDYARLHAQQQVRPKCGEIFYEQEANSFQLICLLCEMKHFAFEDFGRHIRNVHFDKQGRPLTETFTVTAAAVAEPFPISIQQVAAPEPHLDLIWKEEEEADEVNPLRIMTVDDADDTDTKDFPPWQPRDREAFSDDFESDNGDLEAEAELKSIYGSLKVEEEQEEEEEEQQSVFKQKHRQPKDYNCPHCDRKYTTQKYLNHHLKLSHPHPQAFKCNDCGATFDADRALAQHRRKAHTEFGCQLCEKVFKSSRSLLRHIQGHSGVRQFKCEHENCGKSFVNQHNLTSHRRVHSEERNYVCELCGYRSRYREALIVHRRTHTGEKPFQCQYQTCHRCFASKSLLNEHQAMHSTEKPFKCDKCEAAFSRPKALYHHKHLHLGVKKFKCKICDNAYAQAAGLSAHMRVHKLQQADGAGATTTTTAEAAPKELLFTF